MDPRQQPVAWQWRGAKQLRLEMGAGGDGTRIRTTAEAYVEHGDFRATAASGLARRGIRATEAIPSDD